jgi:hypothetical protein
VFDFLSPAPRNRRNRGEEVNLIRLPLLGSSTRQRRTEYATSKASSLAAALFFAKRTHSSWVRYETALRTARDANSRGLAPVTSHRLRWGSAHPSRQIARHHRCVCDNELLELRSQLAEIPSALLTEEDFGLATVLKILVSAPPII